MEKYKVNKNNFKNYCVAYKNMNNNEIQNLKEKIEADLKLLIAEIDNGTTDIWDLKNILNKIKSISIYKKD
jgi:hypothetical protein